MMELLKGGPVAVGLTNDLIEKVGAMEKKPTLAIFRATEDEGALSYQAGACKRMEKIGIAVEIHAFPGEVSEDEFVSAVKSASEDENVSGILVLKPLPKHISEARVNEAIAYEKDADAVTRENRLRIFTDEDGIRPCTPESVLRILKHYEIPIAGKRCVIVGRSLVVGKPLAMMMLKENATVTVCHSKTTDLPAVCRTADILITAIGRAEMIDKTYVKEGAVVIDVGINVNAEGKLCGDCNFASVSEYASAVTPVPGGVGNVTTSILASHVVNSALR